MLVYLSRRAGSCAAGVVCRHLIQGSKHAVCTANSKDLVAGHIQLDSLAFRRVEEVNVRVAAARRRSRRSQI